MSVVGGLTHSALARLAKTNACIPSETQKVSNYRIFARLAKANGCIPSETQKVSKL